MTKDEFLERYRDYSTVELYTATMEQMRVNAEGIEEDLAVVVCTSSACRLMLKSEVETRLTPIFDNVVI